MQHFNVSICLFHRLQDTYEPHEIEFFRLILKEIALSDDHSVRTISILNLMNQNRNKDSSFTMGDAEKFLEDWIEEGYFHSMDGLIYFGIRSIAEFGEFLRTKFNLDGCALCKTVLVKVRIK